MPQDDVHVKASATHPSPTSTPPNAGEGVRVSAVVLSFNSARYIRGCIESLHESLGPHGPYEIFVVDNGSTDGSVEMLLGLMEPARGTLRCIFLDANLGTTVPRNLAMSAARGEFLLVIDSDAIASSDVVEKLLRRLNSRPMCGLAAPRLNYPSGKFQLSTDDFPTLPHKLRRLIALRQLESKVPEENDADRDVDYAISAFWLVRREAAAAIGFLDENIFYSPEDVDFCLRLWEAGFSVVYVPEAVAVHDAQEISRSLRRARFFFRHAFGLAYFFRKHGYLFSPSPVYRRIDKHNPSHTSRARVRKQISSN